MVYRRGGGYRKKTYTARKSYGGSRLTTALKMASSALMTARMLRSVINVEYKLFDNAINDANVTDAGTFYPMAYIAQGDGDNTRNGNSIKLTSLLNRMTFTWNSAGNANQRVRAILLIDRMSGTAASPTIADLFEVSGNQSAILSPLNVQNGLAGGRYSIMYDKVFQLDAYHSQRTEERNLPWKFHVKFDGTTSSDYGINQPYLLLISDQATANYPTSDFYQRIRYIDN